MQVNVFIARQQGALQNKMLILPLSGSTGFPIIYRDAGWDYLATIDTSDSLLSHAGAGAIEADLASAGYAILAPWTPDRH